MITELHCRETTSPNTLKCQQRGGIRKQQGLWEMWSQLETEENQRQNVFTLWVCLWNTAIKSRSLESLMWMWLWKSNQKQNYSNFQSKMRAFISEAGYEKLKKIFCGVCQYLGRFWLVFHIFFYCISLLFFCYCCIYWYFITYILLYMLLVAVFILMHSTFSLRPNEMCYIFKMT